MLAHEFGVRENRAVIRSSTIAVVIARHFTFSLIGMARQENVGRRSDDPARGRVTGHIARYLDFGRCEALVQNQAGAVAHTDEQPPEAQRYTSRRMAIEPGVAATPVVRSGFFGIRS
jgi:hypothetical protein